MKKSILLLPLFLFLFSNLNAQNYQSAVGVRLGSPLSISYKQFINDSHALEAYVGTRGYSWYRWTNISAAYQIHKDLSLEGLEGLQYYYGLGGSVYFWSWDDALFEDSYTATTFGVQGYIGMDYKFANLPLNITLDWVPTYFVNGYGSGFGAGFGSLGIRYTLN